MRSGIVAEFDSADALQRAYERLLGAGYTRLEAWTPYAVRGIVKGLRPSILPWVMLIAGLIGGGLGYLIQWWCNGINFPINVGGRPLQSAPAFIPITFESAVLASSVTGFIVMLAACGLPRLHHPLFELEGFERAGVDRFWIGVDDADPRFDKDALPEQLAGMGALRCARLEGDRA